VLKIPTTNPHKLSAERVAKVTKALVRRLIEKGVLAPPAQATLPVPPESLKPPNDAGSQSSLQFSGILDCRPRSVYRAFQVIEGDKSQTNPPTAPGRKSDHEDGR
jgi:hypothetical protein